MNVKKMAAQDASKWARAEMFFGDGAGTRRKLISVEVSDKMTRVPGYQNAFQKAYEKQNMADHAIKAAKERAHIDHVSFIGKNAKALLTGKPQNMSPSVIILIAAGVVLHKTGYDKVLIAKGKRLYRDVKATYRAKRDNDAEFNLRKFSREADRAEG